VNSHSEIAQYLNIILPNARLDIEYGSPLQACLYTKYLIHLGPEFGPIIS
jgi:hypothetical protein